MSKLLEAGLISRVGRGIYVVGKVKHYKPYIDDKISAVSSRIAEQFPFIQYCVWKTTAVREFSVHQSYVDFTVVDVEKEALESVYRYLKEQHHQVFLNPNKMMVEEYIMDLEEAIIVQQLISEAPLQTLDEVPTITIEKLLVDLVHEKELFYFYQGYELQRIFQQAFDKYSINENKLLRYAARRRKKNDVIQHIKALN